MALEQLPPADHPLLDEGRTRFPKGTRKMPKERAVPSMALERRPPADDRPWPNGSRAKLCVSTGSAEFSEPHSSAVRQPAFDRPDFFSKE